MERKDKYVGIRLYGYCNGFFGLDSYEDKIIVASGDGRIVGKTVRDYGRKDNFEFATFGENDNMEKMIKFWSVKDNQYSI